MMLGTKGAAVSRSMVFNEMLMHETRDSREGRWMSEFFSSNNMRSFMSMHECVRSHMRPCPCQCQCLKGVLYLPHFTSLLEISRI